MNYQEMKSFIDALEEDPYDHPTRLVFSDWLEEHGMDDEAAFHRLWTPEWQQSKEWLEWFAKKGGEHCENYPDVITGRPLTLEDIVGAVDEWLATYKIWGEGTYGHGGEYFVQVGDDTLRDLMYDPDIRKRLWENYQIYRRVVVPEEKQGRVFSCSC